MKRNKDGKGSINGCRTWKTYLIVICSCVLNDGAGLGKFKVEGKEAVGRSKTRDEEVDGGRKAQQAGA